VNLHSFIHSFIYAFVNPRDEKESESPIDEVVNLVLWFEMIAIEGDSAFLQRRFHFSLYERAMTLST